MNDPWSVDDRGDDEEERPPRATWPWLVLFATMAAAIIVAHSPLLSVRYIEVLGAVESSAPSRVADSGVGVGALLLWVDTEAVRSAVASDPWVADVRVDRVWPNRLIVEVIERQPVVWIKGTTMWMRVATDGVVIDTASAPTPELIHVGLTMADRAPGAAPVEQTWTEIVAMATVLFDALGPGPRFETRLAELWTFIDGHEIRFGNPIDLADKARALVALLEEDLPVGARIDVSSPQRPAVVPLGDPEEEVEG